MQTIEQLNAPVQGSVVVQLVIAVKRGSGKMVKDVYDLKFIDDISPEVASKAFRLTRDVPGTKDRASYDIHVGEHGAECDCYDFLQRRRPGGCKHIASLHAARYLTKSELPRPINF